MTDLSGWASLEWTASDMLEWRYARLERRAAALRFGFAHEGTFRQHMVVKGANRDTAWFAIIDGDWPQVRAARLAWLAPSNFDAGGQQLRSLSEFAAA
ncbi:GNAT family N-acetyltransferase [Jannaschia helgolandensis]|uniref:GNAT family N-acetyltransferase n=1 Tax=Jannaschia helgolandensis TaxID=188906 RepID=UPI003C6D85AF|tara:strand:+ start:7411 stop:7704 length:294 start_codon:yes stop_codon:yes gene_type:complete